MVDYKTVHWSSPEGLAMHCIGMDRQKPYKRHGKLFYRPYRNYFSAPDETSHRQAWEEMVGKGYAAVGSGYIFYMTRAGLDWLGEVLGIKIYDEET